MIRKGSFVALALVVLAGVLTAVGCVRPKGHRAARTTAYAAEPAAVFAVISDVARYPEWRSGITSVESLPDDGRGPRFREHGAEDVIAYRVERLDPPATLVTRIDDPSLPYGGTWTFDLASTPEGTALTITEDGEVYNPIFRLLSKTVFSPYATIDTCQADLRRRLETSARRSPE